MLDKYVIQSDGTLKKFEYELHKAISFNQVRTLNELPVIINKACIQHDKIENEQDRDEVVEEILGLILTTGIVLFQENDPKALKELLRTFIPISAGHKDKKLLSRLHDILFKECKKDFLDQVESILNKYGMDEVRSEEKVRKVKNAISQKGAIKQYTQYMIEMLPTMQKTLLTIVDSPNFGEDELSLEMANSFFNRIHAAYGKYHENKNQIGGVKIVDEYDFSILLIDSYAQSWQPVCPSEEVETFLINALLTDQNSCNNLKIIEKINDIFKPKVKQIIDADSKAIKKMQAICVKLKIKFSDIIDDALAEFCLNCNFDSIEKLLSTLKSASVKTKDILNKYKKLLSNGIISQCKYVEELLGSEKKRKICSNDDCIIRPELLKLSNMFDQAQKHGVNISKQSLKNIFFCLGHLSNQGDAVQKTEEGSVKSLKGTASSLKPMINSALSIISRNSNQESIVDEKTFTEEVKNSAEIKKNEDVGKKSYTQSTQEIAGPDATSQSTQDDEDGFILVANGKKKKSLEGSETRLLYIHNKTNGDNHKHCNRNSQSTKTLTLASKPWERRKISDQTDHEKVQKKTKEYTPLKVLNLCELARSYVEAQAREDKKALLNIALKIDNVSRGVVNINEPEFADGPTALDILSGGEIDQGYYYLRGVLTGLGAVENGYFDYDGYPFISLI